MAKIEAEVTTQYQEPFFVSSANSFFMSASHSLINFPMLLSLRNWQFRVKAVFDSLFQDFFDFLAF
jgi:hypothetical protein